MNYCLTSYTYRKGRVLPALKYNTGISDCLLSVSVQTKQLNAWCTDYKRLCKIVEYEDKFLLKIVQNLVF